MKRLEWYEINDLAAQAGCKWYCYLPASGGNAQQNAYCLRHDEYHASVECSTCKKG